jgi:hypothetical protein
VSQEEQQRQQQQLLGKLRDNQEQQRKLQQLLAQQKQQEQHDAQRRTAHEAQRQQAQEQQQRLQQQRALEQQKRKQMQAQLQNEQLPRNRYQQLQRQSLQAPQSPTETTPPDSPSYVQAYSMTNVQSPPPQAYMHQQAPTGSGAHTAITTATLTPTTPPSPSTMTTTTIAGSKHGRSKLSQSTTQHQQHHQRPAPTAAVHGARHTHHYHTTPARSSSTTTTTTTTPPLGVSPRSRFTPILPAPSLPSIYQAGSIPYHAAHRLPGSPQPQAHGHHQQLPNLQHGSRQQMLHQEQMLLHQMQQNTQVRHKLQGSVRKAHAPMIKHMPPLPRDLSEHDVLLSDHESRSMWELLATSNVV